MALIIEDGTGIVEANSFVSVAELDLFARIRGLELPEEIEAKEALLILSADYLQTFEADYQGRRFKVDQGLPFPRSGLTILCSPVDSDVIPAQVKRAQMLAAIEAITEDLSPSETSPPILKERIEGAIDVQYMTPRQRSTMPDGSIYLPTFPKVLAQLELTFKGNECPSDGSLFLKTIRV